MNLTPQQINLIIKAGDDPFNPKFQTSEPIEYVLGKAEFRGMLFKVNSNVLIPRVETEEIIDLALKTVDQATSLTFADIATGSGVIGISFARELIKNQIQFDGYISDISEEAIVVAKENVDLILDPQHQNCVTNKIAESKIKVIRSNLFKDYPRNKKFDIVFANLPYIPSERIDQLDASVRNYEPVLALDGGKDGLDLIRELILEARSFISENGIMFLEVDDTHTQNVADSLKMNVRIEANNDQFDKNRFWIVRY